SLFQHEPIAKKLWKAKKPAGKPGPLFEASEPSPHTAEVCTARLGSTEPGTFTLDSAQQAAVEHGDGPVLIIAGPGTGKTRTLTERIAHLMNEHGVRASSILAITFTRRARGEMQERLQALLGEEHRELTVATFHALGLSVIEDHWAEL